jgi:hypothetical protein
LKKTVLELNFRLILSDSLPLITPPDFTFMPLQKRLRFLHLPTVKFKHANSPVVIHLASFTLKLLAQFIYLRVKGPIDLGKPVLVLN